MAVRVGWLLSAIAVLIAVVFTAIAYLDQRGTDVGGFNVAGDAGLGWVGVLYYGLVPALALIWLGVLAIVVVTDVVEGIRDARRP